MLGLGVALAMKADLYHARACTVPCRIAASLYQPFLFCLNDGTNDVLRLVVFKRMAGGARHCDLRADGR